MDMFECIKKWIVMRCLNTEAKENCAKMPTC